MYLGSTSGEEARAKSKLSDIGDGTGSTAGDVADDVASVKSEASDRELHEKPPPIEEVSKQTFCTLRYSSFIKSLMISVMNVKLYFYRLL